MNKLFSFVLFSFLLSVIFFSCNKDTTVNPGGGTTGPQTQSFTSSPTLNKIISNTQPVLDTIIANITDNILSNSISDIKITLGDVENVEVDKIQFSILHGGTEVMVIDYLTKTGVGSFDSTVFWDSAATPIDQGQSPYTGTFIPQQPLRNFKSADPAGQWIIKITYSGSVKSGVIKSWGITITYDKVQTPTTQIFPTAVGNYWIIEGKDSSGYIYGYDSMCIPNTFTYQNKTLYRLYSSDKPTDTMYAINESDGLYIYGWENNVFVNTLMWKYPISVGNTYIGGGNGDTVFCTSVNETVFTPSGTHQGCIKYEAHDMGHLRTIFYMKPGLGMVGVDHYQNNALYDYERLFSYHLNK